MYLATYATNTFEALKKSKLEDKLEGTCLGYMPCYFIKHFTVRESLN